MLQSMLQNVSIIGNSSWATALVKIFSESRISVKWLPGSAGLSGITEDNKANTRNLPDLNFNYRYITPFNRFSEALAGSQAVIFAVPAAYMQNAFAQIESSWLEEK